VDRTLVWEEFSEEDLVDQPAEEGIHTVVVRSGRRTRRLA
jgi:hypothetical protein